MFLALKRGVISGALAIAVVMGGVMNARPVFAQQVNVEGGYQSIMQQGIIFANICPAADAPCPCRDSGQCELNHILQIFINIAIFILGISGSIILLVFMYGGFLWVTSAGDPKRVEGGKTTMVNAVIGLAIIFGSYAIINFIIAAVAGQTPGATIEDTVQNVTR